jgi:hypothetical protein
MLGSRIPRSYGIGSQSIQAHIDAYGCRALFRLLILHFDHEARHPTNPLFW